MFFLLNYLTVITIALKISFATNFAYIKIMINQVYPKMLFLSTAWLHPQLANLPFNLFLWSLLSSLSLSLSSFSPHLFINLCACLWPSSIELQPQHLYKINIAHHLQHCMFDIYAVQLQNTPNGYFISVS